MDGFMYQLRVQASGRKATDPVQQELKFGHEFPEPVATTETESHQHEAPRMHHSGMFVLLMQIAAYAADRSIGLRNSVEISNRHPSAHVQGRVVSPNA